MPGPLPKPAATRRRRNAAPGVLRLPAEGRTGPAPRWPLGDGAVPPVLDEAWVALWRLPQAVAWERLHLTRVVARYALLLVRTEGDDACPASLLGEVRQLEDRLGLSPLAAARLRWEVDEPDEPEASSAPAGVSALADYRRLIRGGDGGD